MGAAWQTEPWGEGWASQIETRGEGKKYVEAKHIVREEWAKRRKRKLTSFEDYCAEGFYLLGFSFLYFFLFAKYY